MSSESNPTPPEQTNGQPVDGTPTPAGVGEDPGLPPVAPPSGRFIAQLFLVPLLIAVVIVVLIVASNFIMASRRDPDYFLNHLDSANEDIRWRAAQDLAQVLQRSESVDLASDPAFTLGLAERLREAWTLLKQDEKNTEERIEKMSKEEEKKREWKKLNPQRNQVSFLISALGNFIVPAGAPVLCEIATEEKYADLKAHTLRRRQALWAIAKLGENRKRYADLPSEQKDKIIAKLKEEKTGDSRRAQWAAVTYNYLTKGKSLQVDVCLAKCAQAKDPTIRNQVAHAINFWYSPLAEKVLVHLSQDDGHGKRIEITEEDQ